MSSWYSGSVPLIEGITEAGHYLSVNPSMISSRSGQTVIRRIPPDRVLLETDGPFVKFRNRQVTPPDTSAVCEYLATIWNTTSADVENKLQENLERLLRESRSDFTV